MSCLIYGKKFGESMADILIISHGMLARELCNSVKLFLGEDVSLSCVCLKEDLGIEQYKKELFEKIDLILKNSSHLLIVCDLYFGSPYIAAVEYVCSQQLDQNIKVISGANLPMLLELCVANKNNPENLECLVASAIQFGKDGIMQYTRKESSTEEEILL